MFWLLTYLLTYLLETALALDCSKDQLAQYRLKDHLTTISSTSIIKDTPPSQTNTTWYLNLCNQKQEIIQDCPKNSQICGITYVSIPGESPIKTQIISFSNGLNYNILNSNNSIIDIKLDDSSWGSNSINSEIQFHCSNQESIDINWDYTTLLLNYSTPGACLKNDESSPSPSNPDDNNGNDNHKPKKDSSWGWFTWGFIIIVLGIAIYVIFSAWLTTSRSPADFMDAMYDFKETLINLFGVVPGFIKEILEKLFGNGNRGGYSAV